ncbi:TetR/AcrR family transcriptional regulator [Parasphingorhabdus cellanae]|uniref:TetR/AcrR family transcriptional regulator n=1 Tax=Parasphingorhabdus cellanae TaxID=2806553 RepID=A0ABX7T9M0_9SPHN|nr:TetR/AcrR family transcriptional regulator [Parasphingorhabdus cellanae]QTD57272.1 TetR/AcrR family transcriptional regulator [Parasphingorhabdus cellanae]
MTTAKNLNKDSQNYSGSIDDPAMLNVGEIHKSRKTRLKILNAGVVSLADHGHKKLSTTMVAKRAGITRSAMLYHFGSRAELISAIVQHVTRRRLSMYQEAMSKIPHDEHFLDAAIDIAWDQLQTPEFFAFTELSLAARTDPELAKTFNPAMAAYDKERKQAALEIFPDQETRGIEFDLRRDIVRFLIEGIAQQNGITYNEHERKRALKTFLKTLFGSPSGVELLREAVLKAQR